MGFPEDFHKGLIRFACLFFLGLFLLFYSSCGGGGGHKSETPPTDDTGKPASAEALSKSIRQQLSSARAYEVFGENVINDYLDEVDKTIAMAYDQYSSAKASSKSVKKPFSKAGCETYGGTYEKDGVVYEGTLTTCPQNDEDKFTFKFEFVSGLNSVSGTTPQKTLRMEIGQDTETDKCPTSEGKLTGSALVHYLLQVSDGTTSVKIVSDAQLDMNATLNDDADVDNAELRLNIGVAVDETGYPPAGYNALSTASGSDLDLLNDSYSDQLLENLNPAGSFPNAATVGKGAGMGIGMALGGLNITSESAEDHWKKDGTCVSIRLTPETLTMAAGEKKEVEAEVLTVKDETQVEAKLDALTDCGKSITPASATYSPGTNAKFEYTAPESGKEGCFTIKATSKAGKDSKQVTVSTDLSIHIDSTLIFTTDDLLLTGTISAVIPLSASNGILSGSKTITYVSFQQTILTGGCTFVTGALSATAANVTRFIADYDAPGATSMVLQPFHTYESYTAICPDGPPAPSGSHELFFSGFFFVLHQDELSIDGWTMSGWEKGSEDGIPLVKRYERTENINGGIVTESTVIALHTGQ